MKSDPDSSNQYKSGFVAIMGRTNVGKSTLINAILGQPVAAISPRSQTTRRRQLGIYTTEKAQIIFIDTPGLHQPKHKLGQQMIKEAIEALSDSDLIIFMVDITEAPHQEDHELVEILQATGKTADTLILFNKKDLIEREDRLNYQIDLYQRLLPESMGLAISALSAESIGELVQKLIEVLPVGPKYYPSDQVTDLYEREIAADLIRAAALGQLRDEVPHGIAIRIDQFKERENGSAYIRATIFVDRESHKGIVIGRQGSMLKSIGTAARQEIETMANRKVFLELRVKVRKNWRNDEKELKRLGFNSSN